MFDLPPGAERTVQYADFLGPRTSFLLVTIPSEVARGVVARSVAALSKGPNRLLGYVENMSGYYCRDCNAIKPLFLTGTLRRRSGQAIGPGDPLPRDRPIRSRACTALRSGIPLAELPDTPVGRALEHVAQQLLDSLESTTPASAHASRELRPAGLPMKFLCVPCDSPMKLQTVGPPERGSLSVVYSCPECGYEMAMLTNAYETQLVQSLGVRIGPGIERRSASSGASCEVPVPRDDSCDGRSAQAAETAEPIPVRWTSGAEARLANIPEFVRPMARTGIERFARERGASKWTRRSSTRPATSSACEARLEPGHRDEHAPSGHEPACPEPSRRVHPALRRLLEPHLPLQPRLRALLSRRRRHASGRHGELRRSERARHRGMLQGYRGNRRVRA